MSNLKKILALAAAFAAVAALPAFADDAPAKIDAGDTAWMMTSSLLVLFMTMPGLALFYGGLVRTKNMLSVLMQVPYQQRPVFVLLLAQGGEFAFVVFQAAGPDVLAPATASFLIAAVAGLAAGLALLAAGD